MSSRGIKWMVSIGKCRAFVQIKCVLYGFDGATQMHIAHILLNNDGMLNNLWSNWKRFISFNETLKFSFEINWPSSKSKWVAYIVRFDEQGNKCFQFYFHTFNGKGSWWKVAPLGVSMFASNASANCNNANLSISIWVCGFHWKQAFEIKLMDIFRVLTVDDTVRC